MSSASSAEETDRHSEATLLLESNRGRAQTQMKHTIGYSHIKGSGSLTNCVQGPWAENYKVLMKEITEDLNKWADISK